MVQVVVVLSGSMEPGFYRGDILFLNLGKKPFHTGEIVVFNLDGRDIPIVHRIIKVHERRDEDHFDVLTKVRQPCLATGRARTCFGGQGQGLVCAMMVAGCMLRDANTS